ncbi:MAG: hypothetical protein AAF546_09060 [Verrucomicrobiota bacterium]
MNKASITFMFLLCSMALGAEETSIATAKMEVTIEFTESGWSGKKELKEYFESEVFSELLTEDLSEVEIKALKKVFPEHSSIAEVFSANRAIQFEKELSNFHLYFSSSSSELSIHFLRRIFERLERTSKRIQYEAVDKSIPRKRQIWESGMQQVAGPRLINEVDNNQRDAALFCSPGASCSGAK